ncbi:acyltransferase family protein [Microbacterium sp. NPDC076911]|uniref:acyltransferase family protein n=1 Tax=Microbacterium sp. NPDC076911 TaxID=3154958 RepID=UPI00342D81FC
MQKSDVANQIVRRDVAIDALRGLAIVLVVAGDVIGGTSDVGLQVTPDSAWRHSYEFLIDIRMPLCTALSGFAYGLRPLNNLGSYRRVFARGKARRLLIPLVTLGTVFVLMQSLVPGTNSDVSTGDFGKCTFTASVIFGSYKRFF